MKKLVFMFVAVAAISFASCGGNKTQAPAVEEDTVAVAEVEDTLATDSVVADSAAVEVAE
jgi:hypothetical protein